MKTFNTLLVAGFACLQFLATSNAQTSSATATATATSTSAAAAPTQPAFVNTPGLQVSSPFNGMSVIQNTALSISASLTDKRPIGSINISVSKKDGSDNSTVVNISNGNFIRASQIWNVSDAQYPIGDYYINLIVTPNTTATPPTTTASVTQPVTTPNAIPGSNVYYWRALVHVVAPRTSPFPTSAAPTLSKSNGITSMVVAAGVIILGSFITL
ncbi:hypothetical protein BGZ76_006433 [Entomortierella beljakovae]|nr:hypothetical protein BGZ76_006433 [Entomortierella beljakovae]